MRNFGIIFERLATAPRIYGRNAGCTCRCWLFLRWLVCTGWRSLKTANFASRPRACALLGAAWYIVGWGFAVPETRCAASALGVEFGMGDIKSESGLESGSESCGGWLLVVGKEIEALEGFWQARCLRTGALAFSAELRGHAGWCWQQWQLLTHPEDVLHAEDVRSRAIKAGAAEGVWRMQNPNQPHQCGWVAVCYERLDCPFCPKRCGVLLAVAAVLDACPLAPLPPHAPAAPPQHLL